MAKKKDAATKTVKVSPAHVKKLAAYLWAKRNEPGGQATLLRVLLGAYTGVRPSELAAMKWPPAAISKQLKPSQAVIYAPEDLQRLVTCLRSKKDDPTAEAALLTVVLGAFGGMRPIEIAALKWKDVDFDHRRILMRHGKSSRRMVPIKDTLWAFLSLFKGCDGLVVCDGNGSASLLAGYFKEAGVEYIPNGLRQSYATYRLAEGPKGMVAHEMGLSPMIIGRHIVKRPSAAVAAKYWAIRP